MKYMKLVSLSRCVTILISGVKNSILVTVHSSFRRLKYCSSAVFMFLLEMPILCLSRRYLSLSSCLMKARRTCHTSLH